GRSSATCCAASGWTRAGRSPTSPAKRGSPCRTCPSLSAAARKPRRRYSPRSAPRSIWTCPTCSTRRGANSSKHRPRRSSSSTGLVTTGHRDRAAAAIPSACLPPPPRPHSRLEPARPSGRSREYRLGHLAAWDDLIGQPIVDCLLSAERLVPVSVASDLGHRMTRMPAEYLVDLGPDPG